MQKPDDYILQIEGMDCSTCAQTISSYLSKQGLNNVSVDYASGIARFNSDKEVPLDLLSKGLSGLGYKLVDSSKPSTGKHKNPLTLKLIVSAIFTIPLLLHMVLHVPLLHNAWFQFICALPVMIIGIFQFGKNAWNALRLGVLHMDLLIIIGSSAAFVYSIVGVFILQNTDYLFFETSASIITLVLLGNYMEHYAVEQTRRSLSNLQRARPEKAIRVNFFGMEKFEQTEEIEASRLLPTDVILIRTGDAIAVDGEVVWGEADVNEAIISGESVPLHKKMSSEVFAGTSVVSGSIKVQVKKLGENTTLSAIIRLMKAMQGRKVAIQRLADKITAIFVPTVISISILTFVINYFFVHVGRTEAIMRSIAVLVISCPCAMGLATPTALMVGIGFAARKGILFKDASIIELIPRIKQIVFDKTGTLTTGHFSVIKTETFSKEESYCKSSIYSIEKYSSHPIAQSLVKAFNQEKEIPMKKVNEIPGIGMEAEDEQGNKYVVKGYYNESNGYYGVDLEINNSLSYRISLTDELRANTSEFISQLKEDGIKPILLSGDREQRVAQLAKNTGIDTWYAQQKPEDKVIRIQELKKKETVMMIGDGINDAPALAAADVGISMAAQSGITTDAAQVILLNNQIKNISDTIHISKNTYTTIKQNLFWAFAYNVVAIPLAASGFLSPIIGAATMACSDLVVIGNSLLLRYKRLR